MLMFAASQASWAANSPHMTRCLHSAVFQACWIMSTGTYGPPLPLSSPQAAARHTTIRSPRMPRLHHARRVRGKEFERVRRDRCLSPPRRSVVPAAIAFDLAVVALVGDAAALRRA